MIVTLRALTLRRLHPTIASGGMEVLATAATEAEWHRLLASHFGVRLELLFSEGEGAALWRSACEAHAAWAAAQGAVLMQTSCEGADC